MKTISSLLFISLLLSSVSFAENNYKKKSTPKTDTPAPISFESPSHHQQPEFGADLGLGTAGSKFHFGLGLRIDFPVNINGTKMKLGGQSGFYLGPSTPSTWILPVLATATYDFKTYESMTPYLGLGLGFSIGHVSIGNVSASSTDFTLLVKPGAHFGLGNRYYAELPFGTMGGSFAFLPSVGFQF